MYLQPVINNPVSDKLLFLKKKHKRSGRCGLKTDQIPTIVVMLLNVALKYFILGD